MNRITLSIGLCILYLSVSRGFGQEPTESSREGSSVTSTSGRPQFVPWDYRGEGFYPDGKEWAVPIPDPKPPVMIGDYKLIGTNSIFDEQSEPVRLWRAGNQLKSQGKHAAAEQAYLQALQLKPNFPHAAYQLACTYALWNKPDKANECFERACELGFSDYPFCYRDYELGAVRGTKAFPQWLKAIRDNYLANSSRLVGSAVVFQPEDDRPSDRLPAIFLLHGAHRTHEEHFEDAKQWSKLGFLAIAMPGSIPLQIGGFMWSQESVEVTHQQIQTLLQGPVLRNQVDVKQVFVLGFSQGAVHAFQIVVLHPEKYAGAIPVGVGGGPRLISEDQNLSSEFKPRVWFVFGEGETGSKKYAQTWVKVCQKFGWKCNVTQHPGGHQFPDDWNRTRPQVATFLLSKE
jgi:predicted esterase